MSHVIKDVVFGMEWRTAISDDQKELLRLADSIKTKFYTEVRNEGNTRYGFYKGKKSVGKSSAAAILADLMESTSSLFVHSLSTGQYACIAVKDKLPVQGMDFVGPKSEIIAAAKKYVEERKGDEIQPKVFGDAVEDFADTIPFKIDRILSKSSDLYEIKSVKPVDKRVTVLAGVAAMVTLFWYSGDILDYVFPPPPLNVQTPAQLHQVAIKNALEKVVKANQFPADVMAGFIPFVSRFPAKPELWVLKTISCEDINCVAVWDRLPGGTVKGFLAVMGISNDDPTISFPTVDQISRKYTFVKTHSEGKLVLGTQVQFAKTIITWLQELKDQNKQPNITPPVSLLPIPPGVKLIGPDAPVVGEYTFKLSFNNLAAVASLPSLMTIEKIAVMNTKDGEVDIEFKGKYYAY